MIKAYQNGIPLRITGTSQGSFMLIGNYTSVIWGSFWLTKAFHSVDSYLKHMLKSSLLSSSQRFTDVGSPGLIMANHKFWCQAYYIYAVLQRNRSTGAHYGSPKQAIL